MRAIQKRPTRERSEAEHERPTITLALVTERRGDWYFSRNPHLNVISQGRTAEQAQTRVQEEIRVLLEYCESQGTLDGVLTWRFSIWRSKQTTTPVTVKDWRDYREVPFELPAGLSRLTSYAPLSSA